MKSLRAVFAIALLAFLAGLVTACTVGFDPEQSEKFSCATGEDCLSGFECVANRCQEASGANNGTTCIDEDGDGYGVNENDTERQDCPKCENPDPLCTDNGSCCAKDSNDTNGDIHPNAPEPCDGLDNDSDGEVDEPSPCSTTGDCPTSTAPQGTLFSCEDPNTGSACAGGNNCVCILKPANQLGGDPVCKEPLECVNGMYEDVPPACQ